MSDNDMDDIDIDPTPQPAPTFPDFVDLHQYPSISMEQVRQKLQRKTGKPLPYTGYKWAAIFVFNASGPSTPRGWQMELYWRQFNVSTSQNIQAHFYRTPIPNYDSNKYEATLATEVKYPIWKLEPEKLLDPVYQRQQMLQLQQKFKTTPHGALVGALNNSLYGMAAKTQHAPKMEPEYILDNVVADFLQISSDPEVMKLRVILQQLMPIYEQSLSLYDKSFDLSKMVKHERLILSLVNRSMAIQEYLENLITPCMNNPRNQKMKTVLQYITLRRMETVFTLQRMVEKTLLFPTREFELVPKMHHLYRVTLNFIASILTCMDSTKPESLSIDRNDTDMVGSDMEQNNTAENQQDDMWTKTNDNAICPFVKKQLKVLKELMKEITANVTIDTTKMLILVKSMDNQALHFLNVWQHTETDKMESFLIGAQITIQQLQMLKMYKWSMTFLKPFEQVKIIPFLELRLQQQTGISATITAICYTQYLDSKILPPILCPEEITLLKQHQYLREKIHASQFFRIVYLISDIKNATTSIQMMENLYQEIKAVVLSMKETSWILQQEIHALLSPDVQDPKIALVYKIVKGLIKQKENGNFLRHLRTSFPEQDRKQLYEDIEKLLWMVDIMRGNLSLVFDKFLKHIPEKKEIKQDPMMRMSITFNTEIKLNQQEPIMIKMEARKTLEQCMWEYQQLDPILRSPDFCKHAKWTMGSHGNLSIWDSIIVQQINAYNHIHTLVTSPPITMPKYMKKMLVRTKSYIKYNYYNYSKYEEPKRVLPSQVKIDSVLQLDVHRNTFDLYIDTHNDSSKFYDVPTDSNNAFYVAFMNTNSLRWHLYKKFSGNHLPAKCSMANASISTFDQVVYQVPYDHSQRMVVAMDCSYIMSFAVIARVHNATIGTKTIEIYTASPRLKIVIHPDLTVYVNNEQAHIVPSIKPYIVNTTVYYHHSIIALKLLQYRGMIVAELPLIGLNLVFDGNMLTLRGSAMMREKMCGMCSNFDGCKSYEWEGPQWQHFDSAMDLLQAYTVPSAVPHYASSSLAANQGGDESSKNITTTTTTTHRPQEGDMESVSMATCFPRPRNVIFQPVLRPSVICFSKVGVPECPPPHCQLTRKGPKVKVPFTCMKKSQQTETWEEMLKSGTVDIIEELKNMKTSRMRRVSTAVECQPNY